MEAPTSMSGEFSFTPSREEIALGVLERRLWHRRYWTAVATFLPGASALGVLLFERTHSSVVAAIPAMGWLLTIVYSKIRSAR